MQTHAAIRKSGGRLSREDQRRLGDILQRVYDDVIHQGVPDRFRDLLDELDGAGQKAAGEGGNGPTHGRADSGQDPDRLVEAKGFPHDKGSS
jgi:anti-sigma factor NepR-like protein